MRGLDAAVLALAFGPAACTAILGIHEPIVPGDAGDDAQAAEGGDATPTCSTCGAHDADAEAEAAAEGSDELPPQYCDVVYRLDTATPSAQSGFRVANTGAEATDTTYIVGDNTMAPAGLTTPLTPSAFPRGFMRLRFQDVGGAPAAGPVELIEFFLPAQFTVSAFGTQVATNVQYSTGLLGLVTAGCPTASYPECLPSSTTQTLDRVCKSHGSGVLTGTTLTWDACSLTPPAPPPNNPSSISGWTDDQSQIPTTMLPANPGCIEALSVFGVVTCSGNFCFAVPQNALGVQNATYEQKWSSFTFSSTDYATATVGMAMSTIPSPPNTYAGIDWAAAAPVHVVCGAADTLTCNVQ